MTAFAVPGRSRGDVAHRKRPEAPAAAVSRDLLGTLDPVGLAGRLWIIGLLALVAAGALAWAYQLVNGLTVTAMRDYVSWGAYMANFVFFIGISHAGTLISAILRVTDAGWRRPITRMAEAITVIALLIGASSIVIDMGRPDRLLNLFEFGRLQSPILWDLVSVTTYLTGSVLYLYVAMIPDMTILAAHARARGRSERLVRLYERLSLGYRETPEHRKRLGRALGAMAVIIIPVAVSVHTVVSWVFGMTLRPGWHSTIFGPYFVIGAIFSGTAAIITAMVIFRKAYRLEQYLLPEHFHKLGKILLALCLLYAYFTLSEYLTAWYGGMHAEARLLELLAGRTAFGMSFWLWAALGLFLPIGLLLFPSHRSIASIVTASVLINMGMWWKRYLIVVPTLQTPFIPAEAAGMAPRYIPSVVECTITVGAFAGFALLFTFFSRVFPILSIWETVEDAEEGRATGEVERPSAPERQWRPYRMGAGPLAVVVAAVLAMIPWSTSRSQSARPSPTIDVYRSIEDGNAMLVARISTGGRPVPGATVHFAVARTFAPMSLGDAETLADGTAGVSYPEGLPGDAKAELTFHVEVQAPEALAGAAVTVKLAGSRPIPWTHETPRALWSAQPPVGLVATIVFLLACVWSTYGFVIAQLAAMRNLREEGWSMADRNRNVPPAAHSATLLVLACVLLLPASARAQAARSESWTAPQRAAQRANPVAADARSIKRGRQLFERECVKCHGKSARGDGPQAKFLDTRPGDLTAKSVLKQSDGALFWKISEGRGPMPKAELNERELWTVVNYLRTMQGKQ